MVAFPVEEFRDARRSVRRSDYTVRLHEGDQLWHVDSLPAISKPVDAQLASIPRGAQSSHPNSGEACCFGDRRE